MHERKHSNPPIAHSAPWRETPTTGASKPAPETARVGAMPPSARPVIGITTDVVHPADKPESLRAACPLTYARAVALAGGVPMLLPPMVEQIPIQLQVCAGFILIGGDDPRTEEFGCPTHPKATPVHRVRQEYETALLRSLQALPARPVLGVCLGMQMMALTAGGRLNQYMPENTPTADDHDADRIHEVRVKPGCVGPEGKFKWILKSGNVTSHHRQAVSDPGSMSVLATAPDGVIEAIVDPTRPFYLGVQWHPERTTEAPLGLDVLRGLVEAAGVAHRAGGSDAI